MVDLSDPIDHMRRFRAHYKKYIEKGNGLALDTPASLSTVQEQTSTAPPNDRNRTPKASAQSPSITQEQPDRSNEEVMEDSSDTDSGGIEVPRDIQGEILSNTGDAEGSSPETIIDDKDME